MVVDASVLANVLADDGPDGERSRSLVLGTGPVAIPEIADVETMAVLRKRWISKTITEHRLADAVTNLAVLPFEPYPARPFLVRIYELRSNVTSYDAVYVALAEALGCILLTADMRLARASGPRCDIRVVARPSLGVLLDPVLQCGQVGPSHPGQYQATHPGLDQQYRIDPWALSSLEADGWASLIHSEWETRWIALRPHPLQGCPDVD